jgi:hypothetical protein
MDFHENIIRFHGITSGAILQIFLKKNIYIYAYEKKSKIIFFFFQKKSKVMIQKDIC